MGLKLRHLTPMLLVVLMMSHVQLLLLLQGLIALCLVYIALLLYSLEFMGGTMASAVDGWTWDGLSSVALSYVSVLVVLIQLFISLAVYHFLYALVTTFVKWIKGPYLPFKSL